MNTRTACWTLASAACVAARATGATGQEAGLPVILSTDCGTEIDDQWAVIYLAMTGQPTADRMMAGKPTV